MADENILCIEFDIGVFLVPDIRPFLISGYPVSFAGYPAGRITGNPAGRITGNPVRKSV